MSLEICCGSASALGSDPGAYASTAVWAAFLLWIVAMIGGVSYRVIRYFAKPSYTLCVRRVWIAVAVLLAALTRTNGG